MTVLPICLWDGGDYAESKPLNTDLKLKKPYFVSSLRHAIRVIDDLRAAHERKGISYLSYASRA
jgi:hypothetical protein